MLGATVHPGLPWLPPALAFEFRCQGNLGFLEQELLAFHHQLSGLWVSAQPQDGGVRRSAESRPRVSQLIAGPILPAPWTLEAKGMETVQSCLHAIGSAWAVAFSAVVTPRFLLC